MEVIGPDIGGPGDFGIGVTCRGLRVGEPKQPYPPWLHPGSKRPYVTSQVTVSAQGGHSLPWKGKGARHLFGGGETRCHTEVG